MAIMKKLALLKNRAWGIFSKIKSKFFKESDVSEKAEVDYRSFKILGATLIFIFIIVVFLLPNDPSVEFSEKVAHESSKGGKSDNNKSSDKTQSGSAQRLWSSSGITLPGGPNSQVNYNTSMVLGAKGGNAKTQLRAGIKMALKIIDKFIVSQDPVPILAELLFDSVSDSGLKLPAGTRFYGEATFIRGSDRASIQFRQISVPSGQIIPISGMALGKDGQPGIAGNVFSDGLKNTTGQIITTFIGGLAAGSIETDVFGRSKGGVENGLLAAVAVTAKDRASNYGEKLKTQREWIEVPVGTECDAILNDSVNLQNGGDNYER